MDVKWIKLNVGMFDGNSFKKIKKAKIGGESFRDKLTAVWFELLDFAGKCNAGGQLIESPEIPFASIEDIAILIDREPEELQLCMQFFVANKMISVIDDVYMLTNWSKYQNADGLEKIREQNRKRQAKFKENKKLLLGNVTDNVTVTLDNATEEDKERDKDKEKETRITYQHIADMYNEICISFPRVTSLSDKRKQAIKARLNTYSVEQFKEMFTKAESSSFLKGKNSRNWTANFDWMLKDGSFAKILDGNYDDAKPAVLDTTASYDIDAFQERALHSDLTYRRKGNKCDV